MDARVLALSALFAFGFGVQAAVAAENELPRITIYARQKPEADQSVPLSTSVITAQSIADNHIDTPVNLAKNTIGFSFNNPFGRYNASPAMRGMAQPGIGEETTVAFFQDGVYVSGRSGIDELLFDMERVEVARGPQNALYGRNSFGGAVNYVSRLPGNEPRAQLEQSVGTSGRLTTFAGLEGGIVPGRLQGRVAATKIERGATVGNTASNTIIGEEKSEGVKFTLRGQPDEMTDIVFRSSIIIDNDTQPRSFLVAANCQPRPSDGQLRQYCGTLPEGGDDLQADNVFGYGFEREAFRYSLQADRSIDNDKKFTLIAAMNNEESTFLRDDDYQAAFAQVSGQRSERTDYSMDVRLRSNKNESELKWLGGISFYRFENLTKRLDRAAVLGATTLSGARNDALHHSYAVYGSLSHPIVWGVDGTVDARWQTESKDLNSSILSGVTGRPLDLHDAWESFTPKFTLSKQFTPDVLGYISAAKGFKSGGFNERANIFDSERIYQPETNWTYEVGAKTEWFGKRLRANATAFWVDWSDQQIVAFSLAGVSNNFYTTNAASSTSRGVELQLAGKPTEELDMQLSYSYTDAFFDKYTDAELAVLPNFSPNGDVSGNQIPRYSPHQLVFSTDYETFLSRNDELKGFIGTTVNYQSSQATDVSNLSFTGDDVKFNLRSGLKWKGVTASLWADNVLDDRTPLVGIRWQDATKAYARAWLVTPSEGRIIGFTLKSDFGL